MDNPPERRSLILSALCLWASALTYARAYVLTGEQEPKGGIHRGHLERCAVEEELFFDALERVGPCARVVEGAPV